MDIDKLRQDILRSEVVTNPPAAVDELLDCYNDVLRSLLDQHVPVKSAVIRSPLQSPWHRMSSHYVLHSTVGETVPSDLLATLSALAFPGEVCDILTNNSG